MVMAVTISWPFRNRVKARSMGTRVVMGCPVWSMASTARVK